MRLDFPATTSNRQPIASVLAEFWERSKKLRVLEVASGSGQHAAFFANHFPTWTFQPSDIEPTHLESIEAYRDEAGENLLPPIALDVNVCPWPVPAAYDAIFAINLIHISPYSSTEALFAEGKQHLADGGGVYLYGAFKRAGQHTAPSNEAFDHGLRQRDPSWGVRCLNEVTKIATAHGFSLARVVEMPANNLSVLFLSAVAR